MQKSKDAYKIATEIENGQAVGRDPRKMTKEELSACGHHLAPLLTVIREKCLDCCCGNQAEVRMCTAISCPLWPLRMNKNTLRDPRVMTEEQRQEMADRLANSRKKIKNSNADLEMADQSL